MNAPKAIRKALQKLANATNRKRSPKLSRIMVRMLKDSYRLESELWKSST